MLFGRPETVIVVAPELAAFYESIKPRQEAEEGTLVVLLDRRQADRRQTAQPTASERRYGDRRTPPADAARALMAVLGFVILHRQGDRYIA
jgi:hypothetical protein